MVVFQPSNSGSYINACASINVYVGDEMDTQIEPLSDDEDSMRATDQEYDSSDSKSIQDTYQ